MSIKNKILNLINSSNYNGNVDIEIYSGNVLINKYSKHNTGTVDLCKYIATCMTGSYVIARRPWKITPCKYEGTELKDITTYGIVPKSISGVSEESTGTGASYTLTFSLPSTVLAGGTKAIEGLRLYSADMANKYAEIDLKTNPIDVTGLKDASIIIKWKLMVSYK